MPLSLNQVSRTPFHHWYYYTISKHQRETGERKWFIEYDALFDLLVSYKTKVANMEYLVYQKLFKS